MVRPACVFICARTAVIPDGSAASAGLDFRQDFCNRLNRRASNSVATSVETPARYGSAGLSHHVVTFRASGHRTRLVESNTHWNASANVDEIRARRYVAPVENGRDSALIAASSVGSYSVQLSGANNTTGIALVEVFDLDVPPARDDIKEHADALFSEARGFSVTSRLATKRSGNEQLSLHTAVAGEKLGGVGPDSRLASHSGSASRSMYRNDARIRGAQGKVCRVAPPAEFTRKGPLPDEATGLFVSVSEQGHNLLA